MGAMQEIHNILNNRHEVAKEWKGKTGGKVMGYFSHNIPEELIYAAGILPVKILGAHEPEAVTDPYMWNMMHCVSARDCLAQGLQGRYDYLDGLVEPLSCPHTLQSFYSWVKHVPIAYSYEHFLPAAFNGRHAQACVRGEINDFKHSLEEWTGRTITQKAIDQAIEVYNRTRQLIRTISDFRKKDVPPISGSEFMEIAIAGTLTDKAEFNRLLEQIIKEIPQRQVKNSADPRVMLAGACNSDVALVKAIEGMGARIVVDDFHHSGRYYMADVIPEEDRLNALASRMVRKPRSALLDLPVRTAHQHLLDLAREYKVQGVIFMLQKHCDSQQFDLPYNEAYLKNNGVPALMLELDFTNPIGQFRTRVEAFLETLQPSQAELKR